MPDKASDWNLPVSFYFLVTFQNRNGVKFQASFSEVRGIGWDLNTTKASDAGMEVDIPVKLKGKDLVLVRPLAPLSDDLSKWLYNCVKMLAFPSGLRSMMKNKACDVVVKLLDSGGQPLAAWSFNHAYPSAYSLGDLKAGESSLAIETITLDYTDIERLK